MSNQENQESLLSKLTHSFKRAKPAARIMAVFIPIFLLVFIVTFFSIFFSGNEPEEVVTEIAESRIMAMGGKDTIEKSVITDSTTKQGKLAAKVEKRRVASESRKGKSAFEKLIGDEDIVKDISEVKPQKNGSVDNSISTEFKKSSYEPKRHLPSKNEVVIDNDLLSKIVKQPTKEKQELKPKRTVPGNADIYSPKQLNNDPIVGMSAEQYYSELQKRKSVVQKQLESAYKSTKEIKSKITTGFKPYSEVATNDNNSKGKRGYISDNSSNQNKGGNEIPPTMLFQPGDKITAYSDFPIDSRVSKEMVFKVSSKIMRDARISCTFEDKGEFLVPLCSTITYQNKVKPIRAIMLNPKTLSGIIDQDVDDDLFVKSIAQIGVTLLNTFGTAKLTTGTKTTETQNSVVTENTLSDKDILKAALATTIGSLGSSGEAYFSQDAVKTIPAHTQVLITFTQPFNDHWGLMNKKNTNNGVW